MSSASGVPGAVFSCNETSYSFLLKVGGESLTSRMVIVACATVLVSVSLLAVPLTTSRALKRQKAAKNHINMRLYYNGIIIGYV